ncbi:NlpC/P60 family protein [Modestobacter roseus]|uniref:Cell wall-associated NlpC family hydrolase n=1 Tax=Modestobacter roseus TaxID=1181884 RepID=A0A562ILL7_9ACTN|nr:NlpC/P60 family protein [Modestobacter roseus]MQA34568.1 hydrolase [Modestobacter roseus]TWH71625.1 cell wall-associated NlpC family hydrolase [Modestobacter roseus]
MVTGATATIVALLGSIAQPPTEAGQVAGQAQAPGTATELADAAARYRTAADTAARHAAQAQQARDAGAAVLAEVAADRVAVGEIATAAYQRSADERWPLAQLSLHSPGTTGDVLHAQGLAEQLTDDRDARVARVASAAVRAAEYTDAATAAEARAAEARRESGEVLAEVRALVTDLDPLTAASWAGSAGATASPAQAADNAAAVTGWQEYLTRLAVAGVTPPAAAELADPDSLPTGLAALRDAAGTPVPGVALTYAAGSTITVLPAETVAAVSAGFALLGRPYLPGRSGPDGFDCGGFTSAVWAHGGFGLPAAPAAQWAQGTPVPEGQLQVGDLVFTTVGGTTVDDVGIYVGGRSVLSASADRWQVAVREVPDLRAAVRVTVPTGTPAPLPAASPTAPTCSAPVPAPGSDRAPVDPAWGGFANGRIPADQLCSIGYPHRLRCDAAAAYTAMSAAYQATFGGPLCITDSYRSLSAQIDAHARKPRITAVPGTSNHGWALAVDLCGGINRFGTVQSAWMQANAGRWGWVHPDWAQAGGSNPEPWHWEYGALA